MASYQHLLQHESPRFESPAKVFAKLKSKAQREMCASERIFTISDPPCQISDKSRAEFRSPMKKTADGLSMADGLNKNERFGSHRHQMQALTLSPSSSPQKTFGCFYSDASSKPAAAGLLSPLVNNGRHGHTPRESAHMFEPRFSVSRKQSHTEPPPIRDLDDSIVPSRNHMQPMLEEDSSPVNFSASVFSPMINRLRKRRGDLNVSCLAKEIRSGVRQPQERKPSCASFPDDNHNNACLRDLVHDGEILAVQTQNHFPPPPSDVKKRCIIALEKRAPTSPAKIFAYMKEREGRKKQREVQGIRCSSRRVLDGGHLHQSRNAPFSADDNMDEAECNAVRRVPEARVPFNVSGVEPLNRQSDSQSVCESTITPAVSPLLVLIEDPLILNPPQVSIPKKNEGVSKCNKKLHPLNFPIESVINLKRWHLMKATNGLYVEGTHREEGIQWNSNVVVERVSNHVVKTTSGKIYVLVGKMVSRVESGLPKWLLKKFVSGFPPNWKALYEKFLSEPKNRETTRNRERSATAKPKSEASIKHYVKQHWKSPVKTSDSSSATTPSSTKVSRSGRVIKPPLEYWKGGRVLIDSEMNVTIHECYDTSILNAEVIQPASAKAFPKPPCADLPCSEGLKQNDKACKKTTTVPLRKVKAPRHRRNRVKVSPESKPSRSPNMSTDTITAFEEPSGRRTRSRERLFAAPQKQSKPEKSTTRREHESTEPSLRLSVNIQPIAASPELPVGEKTLTDELSNDDLIIRRKRWNQRGRRIRAEKLTPSHPSEETKPGPRRRTTATKNTDAAPIPRKPKQRERTKTAQPPKPLNKSTQSATKHNANKGNTKIPQEQDEDKWTEAEILRLKEAMAFFPNHISCYWAKVARMVGTRSAEECHRQHTSQGTSETPAKRAKKKSLEAPKHPVNQHPIISARAGTLKRKQQVRQFLETMPRENVYDIFSSEYMQNKHNEIPSIRPREDHDFTMSDLEPVTPTSIGLLEAKTPQCLHLTPRMMGSPNRANDDKYEFQLQKRMKKNQFNVYKQAPSSKKYTPTVKRTMRRCIDTENDNFVVWEMFPGNNGALSESGDEEDFYFSDSD